MNRTQRRILANNPNALTTYTQTVQRKAVAEATKEALKLVSYTIALELYDKFDFTAEQINKLLDKASIQMECINDGLVNLDEISAEVKRIGVIVE